MSHPYLEEQIQGLARMCEALICNIHWDTQDPAQPVEGHNGYPASGCHHKVCQGYADGMHLLHFGRHEGLIYELRGERDKLQEENENLQEQLNSYKGQFGD